MASFQANFKINDDTYMMILDGKLRFSDGVIRWAEGEEKGQIYEIIKFDDYSQKDSDEKVDNIVENNGIADFIEDNKNAIIVVTVTVAAAAIGFIGYRWWSKRKVRAFNKALSQYISCINNSDMNADVIDTLKQTIETLKSDKNYEKIQVNLSVREIEILVNRIEEYTYELAKVNDFDVDDSIEKSKDSIIRLEQFLDIQRDIFKSAA
ncbi:hypothetical protein SAMN02910289_01734 [Lachnospiraceae bacterium RM5]|nr:hypothetical protein SAMN02910289_01734 [Lachnospiraceae bacterium RM5]